MHANPIPLGLCQCGCGQPTPIAKKSHAARGHVKGHPIRFIKGHQPRKLRHVVEDRGYKTPCWIWPGYKINGYGITAVGNKNRRAHRIYYEKLKGPVPEGLDLDHLCRVRACCNPDHLEPVTRSENCKRGLSGRQSNRFIPDEIVQAIRDSDSREFPAPTLAPLLGVSVSYVCKVRQGRTRAT